MYFLCICSKWYVSCLRHVIYNGNRASRIEPFSRNDACLDKYAYIERVNDDVIKWKHFRVTGPLWEELTGNRWIPITKASDAECLCFLDLRLNKRLGKLSRRRWFEMHPAHYDVTVMKTKCKTVITPFLTQLSLARSHRHVILTKPNQQVYGLIILSA